MRSWAGVRERPGISSDRGHFFIAPQASSLRAMEPQRVHEAGFSAQANAAPNVYEEVPLSLFCCLFGKGNVQKLTVILRLVTYAGCISAAIKSRLPWLMACQGLPKKVRERCYALFLEAGQSSLQCLDGFSGTCQSRSSGVIWRSTKRVCIPEILWQSRKQVFYELVSREMENSVRVRE